MLLQTIKRLSSDRFVRNLGWLGTAELINRVFRLATTVTLARVFTPYDYGMVSIIYTMFELMSVFTLSSGISAKIIQADEQELEVICNTSYWLYWMLSLSLAILQCLAAYPIALFYNNPQLFLPLCTISVIYLTIPNYLVQISLIDRENRLQARAWCQASQAIVCNVVTVVLALSGWGVWAVVFSLILSFPVWIVITQAHHPWRPPKQVTLKEWRPILNFGVQVIGVELLNRLRMNIDYLIVGRFLGIEALGKYYFAFNAGLGISQSILFSLSMAWYPNYCEVRHNLNQLRARFLSSFKTIALTVVPIVFLQVSLAHFYVPIIFGEKWLPTVPILMMICGSAIPIAISFSVSQLLRSLDKIKIDLAWNMLFTVLFSIALLLAVQQGIYVVAAVVLATQMITMPLFAWWVNRTVFTQVSPSS